MVILILGVAALRLRRQTQTRAAVVVATMAMTTVVLVLFLIDALENDPVTVVSTVIITLLAVVLERVWTRTRERAAAERAPALR